MYFYRYRDNTFYDFVSGNSLALPHVPKLKSLCIYDQLPFVLTDSYWNFIKTNSFEEFNVTTEEPNEDFNTLKNSIINAFPDNKSTEVIKTLYNSTYSVFQIYHENTVIGLWHKK